jgi:acyl carrier protein
MADPLIGLFATVLGVGPELLNDASSPASVSSWDSVANIMLITELEEQFAIELSTSDIESMKTIGDVRTVLKRLGATLS